MAPGGKTLTPLPEEKALSAYLKRLGHVAIAFSGGCDSTLLTAFAIRELGAEHVLPVHVSIPMTIEQETREAFRFAEHLGARCLNLKLDVLQLPEIVRNDKWRCYHCKKYLFTEILRAAAENGFRTLLDGANVDDSGDWRPGARAADELGVLHPFVECGFGKRRIRLVSRRMGLASWTMPAAACLASRIPTGIPLTREMLHRCGEAESILARLGFSGCRVRCLEGNCASLEFRGPALSRAFRLRKTIEESLAPCGFSAILLDPAGYRRGSMNKL